MLYIGTDISEEPVFSIVKRGKNLVHPKRQYSSTLLHRITPHKNLSAYTQPRESQTLYPYSPLRNRLQIGILYYLDKLNIFVIQGYQLIKGPGVTLSSYS